MIERHPRLGFAVLGGVFAALTALGLLIATAGGGATIPQAAPTGTIAAPTGPTPAAQAADQVSRSGQRAPLRNPGVSLAWAAKTGAKAGIPTPAMVAYGNAELKIDKRFPGCHLSWNTLAGIGWIESHHGTIGDRTLNSDGHSSTPILGPALNGEGFAAIRSTPESQAWHGDPTWEHAVGPLQFIASTWDRWGSDGDGDGVADPLDLDDAAFTAARYLCADAHDLSTADGWSRAVHSYNHSDEYVLNVLNAANTYAQRSNG